MTDLEQSKYQVCVIALCPESPEADDFHVERRMEDKYLWTIPR